MLGWRGLSMHDLEPYLHGGAQGRVFGITLDDGYLNNYEHALPVLRRLGFTATAFVVSGQIGGSNTWDQPCGVAPAPLMGVAHMLTWLEAGMEIGAHTRSHVNLRRCDDAVALEEIAGSKRDLERALAVEIRSFCYPYGKHSAALAEMVRASGYAMATTIENGRTRASDDLVRLPRLSVHSTDSLALLLARVTTPLEEWRNARRQSRARRQKEAALPIL